MNPNPTRSAPGAPPEIGVAASPDELRLLGMAGRIAQLGGWSIELPEAELVWSREVAAIHEVESGVTPTIEEGIAFYVPEHRPLIRQAVDRCLAEGTPFDLELEILTAARHRRWVRVMGEAERNDEGLLVRVCGALMDISAHKDTQESLREVSKRLTTTLESITDGFFTLDAQWCFTYVNRQAGMALKQEPAAMLGKNIWDAFPEARGTSFQHHYEHAVTQQSAVTFEEYFPPLNLWVEVNAYPSGRGLTVYFRNVTARKQAEQERAALLASEHVSRREAEAARMHFRALFESVPGLYLVLAPDGLSIIAASEAFLRATYTRREHIIGKHLFEVFPDDPSDPAADGVRNLQASLQRVRLLGQPDAMAVQRYPVRRPPALGGGFEERYWSPLNSPVLGPDGDVIYIIHRVEDVTNFVRRRAGGALPGSSAWPIAEQMEADILARSRELQRLNEHLRAAQRVAGLGSWELHLEDDTSTMSEETCQILRITRGPLVGSFESFLRLVHPDDRGAVLEHRRATVNDEPSNGVQYRIVGEDGKVRHLLARAELVRDSAGKPALLSGTVQDVTEQKAADLRVQAQLSRLELLQRITRAIGDRLELGGILRIVADQLQEKLPLSFCAIALRETDGRHVRIAGIGPAGRPMASALQLDEGHRLSVSDNGLSACMHGQFVYEPDVSMQPLDLHRRLTAAGLGSVVLTPLQVEGVTLGVLLGAREPARGFTGDECDFLVQLAEHVALAMRQAELYGELQTAYDDLRRTQHAVLQHERLRAVGEMASGIAHDINNAIAPVTLYAESLLEKEAGLSDGGRRRLEIIQRAIDDVAHTVARMREFYREDDASVPHMPVSLNSLVRQSIEVTEARWRAMPQRRGVAIDVVTELQEDMPRIRASECEIRDALVNLIFNAVDAMPEGGTLTLRTCTAGDSRADARVLLEVIDTGIGMDAETRRRSIEPFFTTKGERGTGLGLAMVYGTVQRHHAELDIDSAPGQGTTVRLRFRLECNEETEVPGAPAPAGAARRMRLLIVDDEPVVLASLKDILEAEGHRVDTSPGGREAIERFADGARRNTPYDAVITDLGMPYVDGHAVAAAVKAEAPATPVVMLTGWGRRMADHGKRPPNVDHLLGKPPRAKQLRAALARCAAGKPR